MTNLNIANFIWGIADVVTGKLDVRGIEVPEVEVEAMLEEAEETDDIENAA